jgi:chromosome segregation ATPase
MLAIPKQLKPIQDSFYTFKDEFDLSLKNIAILSNCITKKNDKLKSQLDTISTMSTNVSSLISKIDQHQNQISKNLEKIRNLRNEILTEVQKSHSVLINNFDAQASEAESLINDLDNKTNEGLNNSTQVGEQIQTQKFDMKSSLQDLMVEIQKTTNSKLDEITKQVQKLNISTTSEINEIHNEITQELDELSNTENNNKILSFFDQVEREKELIEIEELTKKLNDLHQQINNKGKRSPDSFEDHPGVWEEKDVIFRCFGDGTFKILEK